LSDLRRNREGASIDSNHGSIGYTLAVTLEIADATLGGLALGVGMTTYSHKVGLYQETVAAYEMVLGDGR